MLDFMIAGVQKGGTTALHAFLSQHPAIFFPKRKELHFFDMDGRDWQQPDFSVLNQQISNKRSGQIAGEATPSYVYWEPSAARIRRYNPNIKLIILFREPAERAYSHWAQAVTRGRESLSFSDAIRGGRARMGGAPHTTFSFVERGFYHEQIARLMCHFPRSQLLFLRTVDLKNHHTAVLDQICDFLGISRFDNYPLQARIVPVERLPDLPPPSAADLDYLRVIYRDAIRETLTVTGLDVSAAG